MLRKQIEVCCCVLFQYTFRKLGFMGFVQIAKDPFDFILDRLKITFGYQSKQGLNILIYIYALLQQAILPRCQTIS